MEESGKIHTRPHSETKRLLERFLYTLGLDLDAVLFFRFDKPDLPIILAFLYDEDKEKDEFHLNDTILDHVQHDCTVPPSFCVDYL